MKKSTLIYDGDCEFCQYCVDYLKLKTNNRINFIPFQTETLGLEKEQCAQAIQLVISKNEVYSGAAAALKGLALGGAPFGWFIYQKIPGLGWMAEKKYQWISHHRNFCYKVAKFLCGNPWQLWRLPFTMLSIITFVVLAIFTANKLYTN